MASSKTPDPSNEGKGPANAAAEPIKKGHAVHTSTSTASSSSDDSDSGGGVQLNASPVLSVKSLAHGRGANLAAASTPASGRVSSKAHKTGGVTYPPGGHHDKQAAGSHLNPAKTPFKPGQDDEDSDEEIIVSNPYPAFAGCRLDSVRKLSRGLHFYSRSAAMARSLRSAIVSSSSCTVVAVHVLIL